MKTPHHLHNAPAGDSPSKHSVVSDLTKNIALELRDHNVHVNAICPGCKHRLRSSIRNKSN